MTEEIADTCLCTGWHIKIKTLGMAFIPVETCPSNFAWLFQFIKRTFPENLKVIDATLRKISSPFFMILL